jgi:hypothetical protein
MNFQDQALVGFRLVHQVDATGLYKTDWMSREALLQVRTLIQVSRSIRCDVGVYSSQTDGPQSIFGVW